MFREMRRSGQQLGDREVYEVLKRGSAGVLALSGDDGYPYALPISYVYSDGNIYFHSAKAGHKIDAISRCDKASFCVVDSDDVVPEKLSTNYTSVIAFGRISLLKDEKEINSALHLIADKYSTLSEDKKTAEIVGSLGRVSVIKLSIEYMTGKESRELSERRK